MQLVDELSMIYTTCLMMFATFSYNRSTLFSFLMGVGLSGLAAFITVCIKLRAETMPTLTSALGVLSHNQESSVP